MNKGTEAGRLAAPDKKNQNLSLRSREGWALLESRVRDALACDRIDSRRGRRSHLPPRGCSGKRPAAAWPARHVGAAATHWPSWSSRAAGAWASEWALPWWCGCSHSEAWSMWVTSSH